MEYSYYDRFSFYVKVKIPPTTFERKNLVERLKGKNLVVQDSENKDLWFETSINMGNVFETGFLILTPTQKRFNYISYESMGDMEIMIGPWFKPLE
ncbi:hypothetical protein J4477_00250 [Candidatus Pacearchaeota archaeon]|nr:hypothetical protein [Candidatus Pacearchaeota archaeon]